MNDTPKTSIQAPPIKPEVAAFFDKALPRGGAGNILTLGEHHGKVEPLDFLREQLPRLAQNHHLGTIGLERNPSFNVLLWAYQDRILERELGSKEAAQGYLKDMFVAYTSPDFKTTAIARANLTIAALDSGLRVVAYDGRDRLGDLKNEFSGELKAFDADIKNKKDQAGIEGEAVRAEIRKNPKTRQALSNTEGKSFPFLLREIDHWLKVKPKYKERLEAMENIITLGKENRIEGDAISATLLAAASDRDKNTMTIGGQVHIDGIGINNQKYNSQGTLPHHLEHTLPHALNFREMQAAGRPAPQVTRAVVAGTVILGDIIAGNQGRIHGTGRYSHWYHNGQIVRDRQNNGSERPTIPLIDIDTGKTTELARLEPKDPRLVDLVGRFPCVTVASGNTVTPPPVPIERNQCINPLLNPRIKAAADEVSRQWNDGQPLPANEARRNEPEKRR
jgi:hypothetical protein